MEELNKDKKRSAMELILARGAGEEVAELYKSKIGQPIVPWTKYDDNFRQTTDAESIQVIDNLIGIFNALNGNIYTGKRFVTRKNGDKMVQKLVYNRIDEAFKLVKCAKKAVEQGEEVSQEIKDGISHWDITAMYRKKYRTWIGSEETYKDGFMHHAYEITKLLNTYNTGIKPTSFKHIGWLGGDEDQYYTPHIYNLRGGRTSNNVQFLTCLYVDIDGVTPEEAEQRLCKSDLPKPTMMVNSGGGVHYYWFFNRPAQANGDYYCFIKTWRKLATHFTNQLQGDPQCVDIARLLRIPGTINTKRGVTSELLYFNPEVTYSIMALHKQYNVTQAPTTTQVKQAKTNKPVATKPKQKQVLAKNRHYEEEQDNTSGYSRQVKEDLLTLTKLRNGNTEGYRHTLLFYYKRFGATLPELEDLNNLFVTPVSQNDILAINKGKGLVGKRPKRVTIMQTLQITNTESSQLKQLVPADIVSARQDLRKLRDGYSKVYNTYKRYINVMYSQAGRKHIKDKATLMGLTVRHVRTLQKEQFTGFNKAKRELVESLVSLIDIAVDVISMLEVSVLHEEELQSYLNDVLTINNSLSTLNQILSEGTEYANGRVNVRTVESKIKQLKALAA